MLMAGAPRATTWHTAGWRAAAALLSGIAFGGEARAQAPPMSEARCKALMDIVTGITLEYSGQISTDFIEDLQRKVGTEGKCDGPDQYRVWPNTKDREVLGRIRRMLTAWEICQREPAREECKPEAASGR
jgi:hypothetical protein